jgi:hypothetical protein
MLSYVLACLLLFVRSRTNITQQVDHTPPGIHVRSTSPSPGPTARHSFNSHNGNLSHSNANANANANAGSSANANAGSNPLRSVSPGRYRVPPNASHAPNGNSNAHSQTPSLQQASEAKPKQEIESEAELESYLSDALSDALSDTDRESSDRSIERSTKKQQDDPLDLLTVAIRVLITCFGLLFAYGLSVLAQMNEWLHFYWWLISVAVSFALSYLFKGSRSLRSRLTLCRIEPTQVYHIRAHQCHCIRFAYCHFTIHNVSALHRQDSKTVKANEPHCNVNCLFSFDFFVSDCSIWHRS